MKNCYATHHKDSGKSSTPFRSKRKLHVELQIKERTTVPIHFERKTNVSQIICESWSQKQIDSVLPGKLTYYTSLSNSMINFSENDSFKTVSDARHSNLKTNHSSESWPLEPLTTQLAKPKRL